MSWGVGPPKEILGLVPKGSGGNIGQPTATANADLRGQAAGPVHLSLSGANKSSGARVRKQMLTQQPGLERGAVLCQ